MLSDASHTRTGLSNSQKCRCTLFLEVLMRVSVRDMLADTCLVSFPISAVVLCGWGTVPSVKKNGRGLNNRDLTIAPVLLAGIGGPAFYGLCHVILNTIFRNRKEVSLYSFFRWGNWGTEALRSYVRSPSQYNLLILGPGSSPTAIAQIRPSQQAELDEHWPPSTQLGRVIICDR